MRSVKAAKFHICKRCNGNIHKGDEYYPQRNRKAICFNCGYSLSVKSRKTPNKRGSLKASITKLLIWWRSG